MKFPGENGGAAASPRDLLARLSAAQREAYLSALSPEALEELRFAWRAVWARPEQLAPDGDWATWLVLSGRGFGKTRLGAEWIRELAERFPGIRLALVGRTAADVRDVMVEGESGLLAVHPPRARPDYQPSVRRVLWKNGSMATTYSSDAPDILRGPQHAAAWADEAASWEHVDEAWANLKMGLRLGEHPRVLVTTTPRGSVALLRALLKDPATVVTRGSTWSNAGNLPAAALDELRTKYGGTRLGRQELDGELLDDAEGALWSRKLLDETRVGAAPELSRVVVAVDPAVSATAGSDETGIVGAGKARKGHFYVLADRSGRLSPDAWARRAVALFDELKADRVVAEKNQGGAMVEATLRTVRPNLPITLVHASRGKQTRAEPIAALFEQGRAHLVGAFADLEEQLCTWEPGSASSPDRLDAMTWALTELSGAGPVDARDITDTVRPTWPTRDPARPAEGALWRDKEALEWAEDHGNTGWGRGGGRDL